MTFQQRVSAFAELGHFFEQSIALQDNPIFFKAHTHNPWFTIENTKAQ
jgi:hypothetical protein